MIMKILRLLSVGIGFFMLFIGILMISMASDPTVLAIVILFILDGILLIRFGANIRVSPTLDKILDYIAIAIGFFMIFIGVLMIPYVEDMATLSVVILLVLAGVLTMISIILPPRLPKIAKAVRR